MSVACKSGIIRECEPEISRENEYGIIPEDKSVGSDGLNIGIQVSSFRPVLKTAEEVSVACKQMRSMGCRVVQLQWIDMSVPIDSIAEAMRENDLVSVSVQEIYETFLQNKVYYLDLMEATGSTWLCISRIPADRKSPEGLPLFFEELRELMAELKERGMKLCFHPVSADYELTGHSTMATNTMMGPSTMAIDVMMEALPEMDLCLDLYHCLRCGIDVPAMLKKYEGRICMVHFKEGQKREVTLQDGTISEKEVLVPVGSGDTDWTDIIRACQATKVPYIFAEQESWEGDPFEALAQGFHYLKSQFLGI